MKYSKSTSDDGTIVKLRVDYDGRDAAVASLSTAMSVLQTVTGLQPHEGIVFNRQAKDVMRSALGYYAESLLKELGAERRMDSD